VIQFHSVSRAELESGA